MVCGRVNLRRSSVLPIRWLKSVGNNHDDRVTSRLLKGGIKMSFRVKFWGVRGSIACPSSDHIVYGGNTSCIEVEIDGQTIILDAGTGLRNLGGEFPKRGQDSATFLLTHTHWDHLAGFPFFTPIYGPNYSFQIRAGHLSDMGGVREVFVNLMSNPMFPVPLSALKANLEFVDFRGGESFDLGKVHVRTAPLVHPNGATAYRIESQGRSVCYVTDTEHTPGRMDQNILDLIEGSDLVIYDATYTDDEFPAKVGWGHSTWQEGLRLCQAANVKRYAIFHHDPEHDDTFMEHLESEARALWEHAMVARDNMEIILA